MNDLRKPDDASHVERTGQSDVAKTLSPVHICLLFLFSGSRWLTETRFSVPMSGAFAGNLQSVFCFTFII